MIHPLHAVPEPVPPPGPRIYDPLAVAFGNASLLGVGYLLLGRRGLAAANAAGTVVLLAAAVRTAQVWWQAVLLLWWAAVVAHGRILAGRGAPRVAARGQRLAALGVTVPVLLAAGFLRFDAAGIQDDVARARQDGDCARVLAAQDEVWLGHRLADAPASERGDEAAEACRRIRTAERSLATGLTGDTDALDAGFDILASVLLSDPGHGKAAAKALDGFLDGLPTGDACRTVAITDWLREREPGPRALDRYDGAVARTAPTALADCGDDFMAGGSWESARTHYQRLVDRYPASHLAPRARDGIRRATLSLELATVRGLLDESDGTTPEYCSTPAKYSGAAPYAKGKTNRALFYGNDAYTDRLPRAWRADDAAKAVLVVCAGEEKHGAAVRTCPYENKLSRYFPTDVTFHKIAVPVKVYELRTGRLVAGRTVQIDGRSCPRVLRYTTYGPAYIGPPSDQYVKASASDIRAAFRPLITR
ncbi:hypothetical protein V1L54_11350 [Streptomyces sp. TRM 70361]|uniref:tetratricopeptide repeat protein n=1 Tax=Streptomyces sp. TRM 70361 TaxID=3116553 RepID=UPI002E7B1CC9|nr:hypothetical protein [Streptomyces sp. TRM 70361]MEE1939988.1 hypothetical protein [Streptomyces sp. TRM 70361]